MLMTALPMIDQRMPGAGRAARRQIDRVGLDGGARAARRDAFVDRHDLASAAVDTGCRPSPTAAGNGSGTAVARAGSRRAYWRRERCGSRPRRCFGASAAQIRPSRAAAGGRTGEPAGILARTIGRRHCSRPWRRSQLAAAALATTAGFGQRQRSARQRAWPQRRADDETAGLGRNDGFGSNRSGFAPPPAFARGRCRGRPDARWSLAAVGRWIGFCHRRMSTFTSCMIDCRAKPRSTEDECFADSARLCP